MRSTVDSHKWQAAKGRYFTRASPATGIWQSEFAQMEAESVCFLSKTK
jgi:hypothetical protein